ncbi:MAG: replicative DNA helicase [Succinivibrio sp.]|nr:replicative DNA helicase [Succinivibrio sp.]
MPAATTTLPAIDARKPHAFRSRPPQNLEAEGSFLGALMRDGALFSRLAREMGEIRSEIFYSEKNRLIFEAMQRHAMSSDTLDPTVICNELEVTGKLGKAGGKEYVAGLVSQGQGTQNCQELLKVIMDCHHRRELISTAEDIEESGYNPEGRSVRQLFELAQSNVFGLAELLRGQETEGPRSMYEVAYNLIQRLKEQARTGQTMRGVSTGFYDVDQLTKGLPPGTLNILAARPSMGKTALAMNICANVAMNPQVTKPVLIFSLEMPAEDIALRLLSSLGRATIDELNSGGATAMQWQNIISKLRLLLIGGDEHTPAVNKLFIDDKNELSPMELRSRARKIHSECGGLSLIMVDYIQLMHGSGSTGRYENRTLEIAEISRSLKALSKELNVPVLALAQLNRDVDARKDHRPMNSDLRESGSLEQDADLIMFLLRPHVYEVKTEGTDPQLQTPDDGRAFLIIGKNRNGPIGDIELQFQGEYTSFYDRADRQQDVPPPEAY